MEPIVNINSRGIVLCLPSDIMDGWLSGWDETCSEVQSYVCTVKHLALTSTFHYEKSVFFRLLHIADVAGCGEVKHQEVSSEVVALTEESFLHAQQSK